MTKVIEVAMPEYKRDYEVDHEKVGGTVHSHIKKHFAGKKVVVRALDSSDHHPLTINKLVDNIVEHGTDRYDPHVKGVDYDKHEDIDVFGIQYDVDSDPRTMPKLVRKFHDAFKERRKKPAKIDVYMVYDADYLENVPETKEGVQKQDQFKFKDASKKKKALKAVIKLTS
jgi:hypothetical protein